jgi:hypothetical protein
MVQHTSTGKLAWVEGDTVILPPLRMLQPIFAQRHHDRIAVLLNGEAGAPSQSLVTGR